jgi:hypothetical protein
MITLQYQPVTFYAFFIGSDGSGKAGLPVTVDVFHPAGTQIVSGAAANPHGAAGMYRYTLFGSFTASAGEYIAVFKTTDASVAQKHIPSLWSVGQEWAQDMSMFRGEFDALNSAISYYSLSGATSLTFELYFSEPTTLTQFDYETMMLEYKELYVGQTFAVMYAGGVRFNKVTSVDTVTGIVGIAEPIVIGPEDFVSVTEGAVGGLLVRFFRRPDPDVQAALAAQGYTSARANKLDNLDAPISSINAVVSGGGTVMIGGGTGGTISLVPDSDCDDPLTVFAGTSYPSRWLS